MDLVILPILSLLGCSRVTTVTLEWVGYVPLNVFIIDCAMIINQSHYSLIPRPIRLIPRPTCLIPRPTCLIPRPTRLIPRPISVTLSSVPCSVIIEPGPGRWLQLVEPSNRPPCGSSGNAPISTKHSLFEIYMYQAFEALHYN